ncbi:hypothetical protein H9L39_19937 [Fusarium oxysporum f. sp. albedinis]|nr:hypothetical protein H9L39_19937 [Fusarium oxysporum f. sp. albedinis]
MSCLMPALQGLETALAGFRALGDAANTLLCARQAASQTGFRGSEAEELGTSASKVINMLTSIHSFRCPYCPKHNL